MAKKWLDSDIETLKRLSPKATKDELVKALDGRSWDSIEKKINRLKLQKGYLKFNVCPNTDIKTEIDNQRLSSTKIAYKKVIKTRAFEERIINTIKDTIDAFPPIEKHINIHAPKHEPTEEAAVLLISDSHAGEVVSADETCGLSQYDFETYCLYMQFLVDTVVDIIQNKLRMGFNIQDLHAHLLGDMVSGVIHEEFLETNEPNIFHSVFGGAFVMAQAFRELSSVFRTIYCDCVCGNHGRLTKQRKFKEKWNQWDFVFYNIMAELLRDCSNIKFNIPYSSYIIKEIYGNVHLLEHGDNISSFYGVPMYGIKRQTSNFTELFASQGTYIQYFNIAHFHSKFEAERPKGEIIVNGGWKGGDEYSFGKLHTVGEPRQIMYGMHPRKNKTWEFDINFKFAKEHSDVIRYKYDKRAQWACQVKEKFDAQQGKD